MSVFDHLEGFPDLPPVWLAGMGVAAYGLDAMIPVFPLPTIFVALGWPLVLAGAILIGASALWFWRKRTRIEPRQKPRALIVEGPYRVSRNPIYLGMAIMLAGYGLTLASLLPLLTVPVFVVLIERRFIRGEEDLLRDAFGAEAEAYFSRTRRWLRLF